MPSTNTPDTWDEDLQDGQISRTEADLCYTRATHLADHKLNAAAAAAKLGRTREFGAESKPRMRSMANRKLDVKLFHVCLDLCADAISGEGDGVLDAFVEAMTVAMKQDFEIMEYGEHALGQGADAEAVTYIQIKSNGERYSGVAISKDIIASSLNAFIGAASQLLREQQAAA